MPSRDIIVGRPHQQYELSVNDLLTTRIRARTTWITVFKAAAAAGIAWNLATLWSGSEAPVLAPVLALGTVRSTLYSTVAQGFQSVAGNIIGVALALLLVDVAGINNAVVFGSALVSLTVARYLPISSGAREQVPFIVILVVLLAPVNEGYAASRLLDCLIGIGVGIVVSLVIPELPQLGPARRALDAWSDTLSSLLHEIGTAMRSTPSLLGPDARHGFAIDAPGLLRGQEIVAVDAVIAADQSVRFNPRAGEQRHEVRELQASVEFMQRVSLHVRAIALGVDDLYDRPGPTPRLPRAAMASLADALADQLELGDAEPGRTNQSKQVADMVVTALEQLAISGSDLATVLESVSLLGRVDHLRSELSGEFSTRFGVA